MRAVLLMMWLLHWLPLPVLARVGEHIGSGLFVLVRSRRHIALTNLRLCFPGWTEARRHALAHQHFQAYARSMLERGILWWASERRLRQLIVLAPGLPISTIQAGPVIFLCPHFVSLDVAGVAITLNTSLCSIYSQQSNAVFDGALRKGRSRFHPVSISPRSQGIKPVMRAMRDGMPFFMCPDMDFGAKDAVFVPFFGVEAATLTAPARLAALTGATVIPVVATLLPGYQGWKVEFHPPWDNYPGADLAQATRRMNQFIETQIRHTPAEYFWVHRRFKTRPDGAPGVYGHAAATLKQRPARQTAFEKQ